MNKPLTLFVVCTMFAGLTACQTTRYQGSAFAPTTTAAQKRQLDSRWFDTDDEKLVISAIISVFQDLGFQLKETDADSGLVSASKGYDRGLRLYGGVYRATATTNPHKDGGIVVRTTFQGVLTGSDPRFHRSMSTGGAQLYQDFYDKLSQSLFLEANNI